jgi:hypothetical protein
MTNRRVMWRVKKIKFGDKNKAFHMTIFIFFNRPQNISFYGETLQMCLDCEYLNKNYQFLNFRIYFLGRGSICTREPN